MPIITSSNSATPENTNASNSKAVLSALKALQDKLRRVEDEKADLEDKCATLRAQIRTLEASAFNASKKATYDLEQAKDAAHAAYQVLQHERNALQSDLETERQAHAIKCGELNQANDLIVSYRDQAEKAHVQNHHEEKEIQIC